MSSGIGLGGVPRLIVTLWFLVELCYLKWPRLISNCTVAWHLRRNRRSEPEDRSKPSVLAREVSQIALILVLLFSICVSGISHQANLSTSHIMELEQVTALASPGRPHAPAH